MTRLTFRSGLLWTLVAGLVLGDCRPVHGFKMKAQLFSEEATIEVSGMAPSEAEPLIRDAFAALQRAESSLSLKSESPKLGALAQLEKAAGSGQKTSLSPQVLQFLSRALDFCMWSDGAHGPLGAPLYDLRARRPLELPGSKNPNLKAILDLVDCQRLSIDPTSNSAELGADSRFDLRGFDHGFAVDRGIEALTASGVANAAVRVGGVVRAMGNGPEGRGWPLEFPPFPGLTQPLSSIYLRNQAAAFISLQQGGNPSIKQPQAWLNLRTGNVAQGVVGVVVVTEMALDAQGLASTVLVLGERQGRLRIGAIRPQPSILWLLGTGQGEPLLSTHHWAKAVFVN